MAIGRMALRVEKACRSVAKIPAVNLFHSIPEPRFPFLLNRSGN